MRPLLAICSILSILSGCQHIELRNHTVRHASTLTDLQYKQVLGNLAMFSQNPNSLPYFSATGTGLINVSNSLNTGGTLSWDKLLANGVFKPFQFDKAGSTFGGTSTAAEQWTTGSVLNPDELLYMRCVYQMTVGAVNCDCDCSKKITAYFQREPCYLTAMRPGWFEVGPLRQVPAHAAYVGRYKDTFVWVMPENVNNLTLLTLAVMDIATAVKIGDVGRLGDTGQIAAKVKEYIDRAKGLSDLIAKVDPKQAIYGNLKRDLDNTLSKIHAYISREYTPEQVLSGVETVPVEKTVTEMAFGPFNVPLAYQKKVVVHENRKILGNLTAAERAEVANDLKALAQPAAPASAPERKNFYNPLQQNIVPVQP
ncbi:hypothetical protein R5W24_003335 [Gemmata sp. JC717]|uniref:hypothetical protein n=1 Tax=Gemmata algarum TaxID=2975278 RepID=UPI0021BA6AD1|nr:hypothetical protein [Gemmata algarum]MDY3554216.1 hypothetical protein [Gemmata algarum]